MFVGSLYTSNNSKLFRHPVNLNATPVIARDVRVQSETVVLSKVKKGGKALQAISIQVLVASNMSARGI